MTSRDTEDFSSVSEERAARLLYRVIRGHNPPEEGTSEKFDEAKAVIRAITNAAVVQAVKRTDPAQAQKGG